MRWILFISLHLLVFLIIILSYAEAKEEWTVTRVEDYSYASVSGEIQYNDKFAFILMPEDNCNKITTMFSFYTWNDPGDHRQLIDRHIPVKLNGITIDRHAIAIYLGDIPNSLQVSRASSKNGNTQIQTSYKLAAKKLGVHHNSLQATTWLEWRINKGVYDATQEEHNI